MSASARGWSGVGRLTLGHLVALNDEIAALVRAGFPLERGLRSVGRDASGRLGAAMTRLSDRMEQGVGLSEALAAEGDEFPPIYRAVVEAGIRAGRLPIALEQLASFIRAYAESRRAIGVALGYPLIVLMLAYALFLGMMTLLVPRFGSAYIALDVPIPPAMRILLHLSETALYWGPAVPAVVVILGLVWVGTGRASSLRPGSRGTPLRWVPWMRSMLAQFEAANFAQLLALLVEQGVPYPDAITLAADSSGDPALARAGRTLADAVRRGDLPSDARTGVRPIPPLLRWLLSGGRPQTALAGSLRTFASVYRKRAMLQAEKIRAFLPIIFLFTIGMTATLLYALTLFLPFATLLREVATP